MKVEINFHDISRKSLNLYDSEGTDSISITQEVDPIYDFVMFTLRNLKSVLVFSVLTNTNTYCEEEKTE